LFGRIDSLKDSALETFLAAEDTRTAAQVSLASAVAVAYLTLAADCENLALAGETLAAQKETYDLILQSRDFGMADDLQLRQAQSQVEASRVEQARLLGLVTVDRNALNLLVGTSLPEVLLPRRLSDIVAPKAVNAGLSSNVLLARPDIMAAEHRLKAINANIGAARAALFPSITLTAAGGTSSGELSGLFDAGSKSWSFNPQISLPIFTGGALRANLRKSEVERQIAVAEYEKAIQVAFQEVSDALSLGGTLNVQRTAQEALVDALDATHRLALTRWEAGMSNYLEVLVAERSLFSARQGLISLRLADEVNRITLYKVLGGGGDPTQRSEETKGGA
ncbi:MAG: efflux transporter outer membrane subunit, partial [Xanthomonadales bacterium]|nr:efflux transporter outer membrane subunit [Xanthomonadales bacterium]